MRDHPRLRSHLAHAIVDADKVFFVDEQRHFLLEGAAAPILVPLLDGRHATADLLGDAGLPLAEVLGTLRRLDGLGHLAEGTGTGDAAGDAYWDALGLEAREVRGRLEATAITLTVLGEGDGDGRIAAALAASGLTITDDPSRPSLDVVVCDDYLDPALDAINREHVAAGRPWLLARLQGMTVWLGPAFSPPHTACWACLAQRLAGNRQVESYLRGRGDAARVHRATPAASQPSLQMAAGLVAAEAQALLAGAAPRVGDALLTLDLRTLELSRHPVVRLPQCPACGDPTLLSERDPQVVLTPQRKRFTADGGHRVCTPEETYMRLERHISPVTGAVTTVARQTKTDNGVSYSYSSGHNFALMQDNMHFLRKNMRGLSGGKGRTDHQARVGAVCEAIERFNGVWRGEEPVHHAAFSELGDEAVHPEELLAFSDRQYDERETTNARQLSGYHLVPERLPADLDIDWTSAWSLTHERERLVPSAYCWFGHPDMRRVFFCSSDANGCAAGNSLEEAILQGTMELVERDSVALWWYNRARRPAVDLDSFDEPYVAMMRQYYASIGRELWVIDLTTDLGITALAAVSRRIDSPVEDILVAFGAHVDPRMALLRSLTELNQFLPAVTDTAPDGSTIYWMDDPDATTWWKTATLETAPYVVADPDQPARTAADFAHLASDDLAQDVRTCVDRFEGLGLEMMVLDQTRPDIDLSVCKVMVPGLRHFWRRLGAGRLYEVPVALGWLEQPQAEEDLNPLSIFF